MLAPTHRATPTELPRNPQASYYRARYYDPTAGRFITEDATRFANGINFYLYARNDPALYADPTGFTSYEGFIGADLAQMELAVRDVKDKLKSDCPSCAGKDSRKLLDALEGATFVYNPKLENKDCGQVSGPIAWLKHRAEIGPDALKGGCCFNGSVSNSLPSTALHETFHLVHKLPHEGGAYGLEKKCFGCERPPKAKK